MAKRTPKEGYNGTILPEMIINEEAVAEPPQIKKEKEDIYFKFLRDLLIEIGLLNKVEVKEMISIIETKLEEKDITAMEVAPYYEHEINQIIAHAQEEFGDVTFTKKTIKLFNMSVIVLNDLAKNTLEEDLTKKNNK
jgi:hypothetical protein